ncbi:hypothetical protein [Persicobacter diffluens]|uniref:hypothetical protein n=1 Tax=Persicobacter diffluens TaxID=981 RepID=UPI0030C7310D
MKVFPISLFSNEADERGEIKLSLVWAIEKSKCSTFILSELVVQSGFKAKSHDGNLKLGSSDARLFC